MLLHKTKTLQLVTAVEPILVKTFFKLVTVI